MRIVTFLEKEQENIGFVINQIIYPCQQVSNQLPKRLIDLLQADETLWDEAEAWADKIANDPEQFPFGIREESLEILAPLPRPTSFRDAYAFRQHVETSRANRGLAMIPEFDEFPVFYFSNHLAIQGPGNVYCMPRHFDKLDYELEVAMVIKKQGKNITAAHADDYIAGFMILNDISARQLQMEEMKLNLGPAKGKDFASAFGPYFVSKQALKSYQIPTKAGHSGITYDLKMEARVNGKRLSSGSLADMHWTFAEIIERVSYGVTLYPGDVIGSGTVGTGCLLELNGTGARNDPNYKSYWLQANDVVALEVSGLGILRNKMIAITD